MKDFHGGDTNVTVTVYTTTGTVHIQGSGHTSFFNQDLVHMGQQVKDSLVRTAGQEAPTVPTQGPPAAQVEEGSTDGAQPQQPQHHAPSCPTGGCHDASLCATALTHMTDR